VVNKVIDVCVYGVDIGCSGCNHLPSTQETVTWLQAIFLRKYGQQIKVRCIDIDHPVNEKEAALSKQIIKQNLLYPVIIIEGEIVSEGNPRLRDLEVVLHRLGVKIERRV
jgi:disulfide oxidoreductase YuzD